jgi:hypothetical protein
MKKLLLLIVGLAFVSLTTVQAGGEGGCGGCKDKKEETKKEDPKKS